MTPFTASFSSGLRAAVLGGVSNVPSELLLYGVELILIQDLLIGVGQMFRQGQRRGQQARGTAAHRPYHAIGCPEGNQLLAMLVLVARIISVALVHLVQETTDFPN